MDDWNGPLCEMCEDESCVCAVDDDPYEYMCVNCTPDYCLCAMCDGDPCLCGVPSRHEAEPDVARPIWSRARGRAYSLAWGLSERIRGRG